LGTTTPSEKVKARPHSVFRKSSMVFFIYSLNNVHFLGKISQKQRIVAIKKIKIRRNKNKTLIKDYMKEVEIMKKVKNKNVVKYYTSFRTKK